ncbi:unnamed protein product [Adineta ricciae]|uniref:Uncharacterized protein n=1 Tax=Adineta ricciae TaxID=249248 RepID=A0A814HDE2_ADIRI|nr:unnamed protein product [Adineta ricciae]CAF1008243.1 unnamed protein product [Adineta ricciae]
MILTRDDIDPCKLCNVLAPIFICGFFGNIICIIVFLRRRFRVRSISVYFIALFFIDCMLLFISHVAKMLIFGAAESCWFNIFLSKFIDLIRYKDMLDHGVLSVLTYNTTYTQISMLIFMFMSIQRVRTFSSISYRESRMCAFMLTLIAFVYGIIVSYMQLYDGFCIKQLDLTKEQTNTIDTLMDDAQYAYDKQCLPKSFSNISVFDSTTIYHHYSTSSETNESLNSSIDPMCHVKPDWHRTRHQTVAYVYLQSYMSIDWPDEYANRSMCDVDYKLSDHLLSAINNLTRPWLQSRPGKDYFLEHQFCAQSFHFIESYANCSFPLSAKTFQKYYQFLYDRRLSLKNRYTIGFIIGTFIPSFICILSSFICLYYIANQPLILEILLSLMSALQSYIINFFTCHGLLFRMQSDNCYGPSSNNILPMFLGSILELFTSTSNILILMICGAQFRNELIEILHLTKFFSKEKQRQSRTDESKITVHRPSAATLPLRITLPSPLIHKDLTKRLTNSHDPSMESFLMSGHNKDDLSVTETEQQSEETSLCLIKLTSV